MSQAEALLNTLSSDETTVYTRNSEIEGHIVIGNDRFITVPDSLKRIAVQHDHNIETVTFDCPRYWDNHDMSQMKVYITYLLPDNTIGSYLAQNVTPIDNTMTFTWTISGNITQTKGTVSFLVCAKRTDDDGNEILHWNSELNTQCYISEGLEGDVSVTMKYPDIVTQLLTRMEEVEAIATIEAMQSYTDAWLEENHDRVLAEIEAKGADTLASIPEDYQTAVAMADEALRTRAKAIVCDAEGETIVINDSSDDLVCGLKVFGKSTQDDTPTPYNPVEIVSVETPTLKLQGKNLVDVNAMLREDFMTSNGDVYTLVKGDARFTRTQTCYIPANTPLCIHAEKIAYTGTVDFWLGINLSFEDGTGGTVGLYVDGTNQYSKRTFTKSITKIGLFMSQDEPDGATTKFRNLQIEIGSEPTEYEPYKSVQTLDTTHTLRGIPVTSGGNYTDSDGQQWICDEVDFERGVYVQRTKLKTLYDRTNWLTWGADVETEGLIGFYTYCEELFEGTCLSNAFPYAFYAWGGHEYGAGAYAKGENSYIIVSVRTSDLDDVSSNAAAINSFINFISKTNANILVSIPPIETPLTAEEIAAFKALRTNYPNTTILNDAGAHMSVKYNADTKLYVDNKISAAISVFLAEHQIG